jgi:hypothetical protein
MWPDADGNHIQAHGGAVLQHEGAFYWFGEDRSTPDRTKRYISCYSSKDLINWTHRKRIEFEDPYQAGTSWVLERPKVYFNAKTNKFVMYAHLDDRRYAKAEVLVAVSDTIDGDYKLVSHFRPLDHESRDIGQFIDDDGAAYLIFEDRRNGFHIARLSEDYLTVEKDMCLIKERIEGGAIVKHEGLYYCVGSALTGWRPNPNKYATAKSLEGPWSSWKDIAPREANTYNSQSTFLLKIAGSQRTTIIFMGDMWRPRELSDSRYLWMPLEIANGRMSLAEPRPWKIDVETGEITFKAH